MLSRTAELVAQCAKWYEGFEFHRVFHALHDFAVVDLSAFYFDVLKDRLYTFAARNRRAAARRNRRLPHRESVAELRDADHGFTAEEIWRHFPTWRAIPRARNLALFENINFDVHKQKNRLGTPNGNGENGS